MPLSAPRWLTTLPWGTKHKEAVRGCSGRGDEALRWRSTGQTGPHVRSPQAWPVLCSASAKHGVSGTQGGRVRRSPTPLPSSVFLTFGLLRQTSQAVQRAPPPPARVCSVVPCPSSQTKGLCSLSPPLPPLTGLRPDRAHLTRVCVTSAVTSPPNHPHATPSLTPVPPGPKQLIPPTSRCLTSFHLPEHPVGTVSVFPSADEEREARSWSHLSDVTLRVSCPGLPSQPQPRHAGSKHLSIPCRRDRTPCWQRDLDPHRAGPTTAGRRGLNRYMRVTNLRPTAGSENTLAALKPAQSLHQQGLSSSLRSRTQWGEILEVRLHPSGHSRDHHDSLLPRGGDREP